MPPNFHNLAVAFFSSMVSFHPQEVCLDDEEERSKGEPQNSKTLSAPLFHEIVEAVARELAVLELLQLARVVWLLTVWG